MYFNGEPYGDHGTPHARKLPWEKTQTRETYVRRRLGQAGAAQPNAVVAYQEECDDAKFRKPYTRNNRTRGFDEADRQGTAAHWLAVHSSWQPGEARVGEGDDMLDSDDDDLEKEYKQHLQLHLNQQRRFAEDARSHKSLTESAKHKFRQREKIEARDHRSRNGITLRTKLRASAYTAGGIDYRKLFRFLDLDNSGQIDEREFISLCRKSGKVVRTQVTDEELLDVFHNDIDRDHSGSISIDEFIAWIEEEPMCTGRREESQQHYVFRSARGVVDVVGPVDHRNANWRADDRYWQKTRI